MTSRLAISEAALLLALLAISCGRGDQPSLERAARAWNSKDYEQAAEEYERYLARYPATERSAEARLQLANIYYLNLHRYDRAMIHYREFLNQYPSHPESYAARERLAEVLSELGRFYEAIAEYENLRPKDERDWRRIRLLIADLYFKQHNYSQALTEYDKVITGANYDDLSERAYLRQAAIYHLARGQYQQALPVYKELASRSPDPEVRRRAIYGMADCYAGLYNFDEAIKTLQQIKEPDQQKYISERIAELERRKRDIGRAPEMKPKSKAD